MTYAKTFNPEDLFTVGDLLESVNDAARDGVRINAPLQVTVDVPTPREPFKRSLLGRLVEDDESGLYVFLPALEDEGLSI